MRVMDEKKLQEITEFIKQYARENNGDAPGLADIMDYMSMAKTTAYRYMLELKKRGICQSTDVYTVGYAKKEIEKMIKA